MISKLREKLKELKHDARMRWRHLQAHGRMVVLETRANEIDKAIHNMGARIETLDKQVGELLGLKTHTVPDVVGGKHAVGTTIRDFGDVLINWHTIPASKVTAFTFNFSRALSSANSALRRTQAEAEDFRRQVHSNIAGAREHASRLSSNHTAREQDLRTMLENTKADVDRIWSVLVGGDEVSEAAIKDVLDTSKRRGGFCLLWRHANGVRMPEPVGIPKPVR